MTRTDDILNQIDNALEDGTVSYDAMRSRPTAERPAEPTVWIAPAGTAINGDGWARLEGVSDVEFIEEEPDVIDGYTSQAPLRDVEITVILSDQLAETAEIFAALRRAALESVRRSVEAATHAIQQFSTAFDDSEWIDSNGDAIPAVPVVPFEDRTHARKRRRRPDRPAWQSPYGPARRR